jgi:hypothetical protein
VSFLNILKGIGKQLLAGEQFIAPVVGILYPPAAPWITKLNDLEQHLQGSIISTEAANPLDGQGGIKSAVVNGDLNSYIDTMNAGLAFAGKKIQDDPKLRQAAIDAGVAAFNASAAWQASFKTVDLPKAAAA